VYQPGGGAEFTLLWPPPARDRSEGNVKNDPDPKEVILKGGTVKMEPNDAAVGNVRRQLSTETPEGGTEDRKQETKAERAAGQVVHERQKQREEETLSANAGGALIKESRKQHPFAGNR